MTILEAIFQHNSNRLFFSAICDGPRARSLTYAVSIAPPLDIIYKQNPRSCLATKPGTLWGPNAMVERSHCCSGSAITHRCCHCSPAIPIWWLDTSPYRTTQHTHTSAQDTWSEQDNIIIFCKTKTISPSKVAIVCNISLTFACLLLLISAHCIGGDVIQPLRQPSVTSHNLQRARSNNTVHYKRGERWRQSTFHLNALLYNMCVLCRCAVWCMALLKSAPSQHLPSSSSCSPLCLDLAYRCNNV